jgi:hypothetical protein
MPLTDSHFSLQALWGLVLHLVNFALPALGLATLLAPAVAGWRGLGPQGLWRAWWPLAGAGLLVLVAGLIGSGRDGRMATYAGLVLVIASLACWLQGRRSPPPLPDQGAALRAARPR